MARSVLDGVELLFLSEVNAGFLGVGRREGTRSTLVQRRGNAALR